MLSVAAYCRVSTDSTDQLNSFDNQQSYFKRELSKNPNYRLFKIYADRGISGTRLHRYEFDKMLVDAGLDIIEVSNKDGYLKYVTLPSSRSPKFKYIFVKNTSRFARNVEIESIFRDLSKKGVYVVFLDLGKSTEIESDRTYIQIFCSFDERESRDRRQKVLFGINEGDEKGVIRTSSKLYGYRYIQKENRLEIVEEEAAVIRLIFEKYSQGLGIRQIINYLTEHGYTTRNKKLFGKTTISRILDNEKYFGYRNNRKFYLGNDLFDKFTFPHRRNDGDYTIEESDKIPAIISKDLYYKCKSIRDSKINTVNQKGVRKPSTKFAGIIFCEKCGCHYIRNCDNGRFFYVCKQKKQFGKGYCDNRNISEKDIEKLLEEFYNINREVSSEYLDSRSRYWYALAFAIASGDDFDIEVMQNLKDEEKAITERLDALYDLYTKKDGITDFLKQKIDNTESELVQIKSRLLQLQNDGEDFYDRLRFCFDKISQIESLYRVFNSPDDLIPYINIRVGSSVSIRFNVDIDDTEIITSIVDEIYGFDYCRSNPAKIAYIERLYQEALYDIDATKAALKGILDRLEFVP